MGYRHSKADMVAAALAVVADEGLARLSYGKVAARLGINDRTVVYYFPTKESLVAEVLDRLRGELQELLEAAFGHERLPSEELVRRAWRPLTTPGADRTFATFFELLGLAAAGTDPFRRLAKPFVEGWIEWLADRVDATTPAARRRAARGVVAQLDGLLLMRQVLGSGASDDAAKHHGLRPPRN